MANHKRIFRIMRQNGMLLARHTGRRKGRLHDGKVVVMRSNRRWCSERFNISCWNGDLVRLAFIIELTTARSLLGMRSPTPVSAAAWFAT